MGDPANTSGPDPVAPAAPAARKAPPPVVVDVFLDNTKDFSTIHGERGPSDPHYGVCFIQNGLPFDAEQKLMANHAMVRDNPKAKAIIEKMVKRAEKLAARRAAVKDDEDHDDDSAADVEDDGDGEIDLKAWARGAKQNRWQLVSDAIVLRTQRRVTSKRDALETLITEGIVQPGQLSPEHRAAMNRL